VTIQNQALTKNQQAIVDVARRLIVQKGVDNTSLADIAKQAGISKGTLYYYYSSKNDLIFDITVQHIDQITSELLQWVENMKTEANLAELLSVVFETMLRAESKGKLRLYLILEAIMRNDELKQRFVEKYYAWRNMIQEALDSVMGQNHEHKAMAYVILNALDGFIIQSLLGVDQLPLDKIAQQLVGAYYQT
jgi:AcrR family transcriptional regulator